MSQLQILLVDDEVLARKVIAQALVMLGYGILQASDGREALEKLTGQQVDLVITDIHMPGMNGLELLKELHQRSPEIPVILITGFGAEEARKVAEDHNAKGILLKPFRLMQLKQMIEELLPPHQADPE